MEGLSSILVAVYNISAYSSMALLLKFFSVFLTPL